LNEGNVDCQLPRTLTTEGYVSCRNGANSQEAARRTADYRTYPHASLAERAMEFTSSEESRSSLS